MSGVLQGNPNKPFPKGGDVQNIPTWMPVAAVALRDGEGRILLQQRPAHKHHGGLWEFPGGKVEPGETPRLAAVRELAEELGIACDPASLSPVTFAEEAEGRTIVLILYTCPFPGGEIAAREGQAFGWHSPASAARLPLAPMDRHLLSRIDL